MKKNILIIGAGAWGSALAILASRIGHQIFLKTRNKDLCDSINIKKHSPYILDKKNIDNIIAFTDFPKNKNVDFIIFAVSSQFLPNEVENALKLYGSSVDFVIATKGMIHDCPELYSSYFKRKYNIEPIFLSGPTFAVEVANGIESSCDVACANIVKAEQIVPYLRCKNFHVKTSSDVISLQISGCFKNIVAIYSGYIYEMGLGENFRAQICTDSITELGVICEKLGGRRESVLSYSGVGDLVLSSYSPLSRNFTYGTLIAKYKKGEQIIKNQNYGVVEGKLASKSLSKLCEAFYSELKILPKILEIIDGFDKG